MLTNLLRLKPLRIALPAFLAVVAAAGCTGRLECNFVSTNMTNIMVQPTDAAVIRLQCNECYWWVDEAGRLNVAGKFTQRSPFGKQFDRQFLISFVLGEPSKGVGKNYSCDQNTVRGQIKTAANMYRFKSVYGILGIEHRSPDVIIGSYRMNIALQSAKFLGGWGPPRPYLMFGKFEAGKNGKLGTPIRKLTEATGLKRRWLTQTRPRRSGQITTTPITKRQTRRKPPTTRPATTRTKE